MKYKRDLNNDNKKNSYKTHYPIVFRAEVSRKFGFGHIIRCLSFAESLPVPVSPFLVMHYDNEKDINTKILVQKGWTIIMHPENIDDHTDAVLTVKLIRDLGAKLLVTDLVHSEMLRQPSRLVNYHRALKAEGIPFLLSIEDCRMAGFASDTAIVPIPCSQLDLTQLALDECHVVVGFKYFIFHPKFVVASKVHRKIRKKANRILVSIAGTDTYRITPKVVRALASFPNETIEAKILLSTGSAADLLQEVTNLCKHRGELDFLHFRNDMAELFLWADLSITGEGFVKYEAAITGTPNLMISQFDHDSLPIQSFLKIGSAKYLGPGENISEHDIAAAIDTLLNDFEARSALSKAGKKALDGRGIERIFNEILKNIFQ